jgi:hypothetical protein
MNLLSLTTKDLDEILIIGSLINGFAAADFDPN